MRRAQRKERDVLLQRLDIDDAATLIRAAEKFARRWNIPTPPQGWARPDVPLAALHKARLSIRSFSYKQKLASAKWLLANDYELPENIYYDGTTLTGVEFNY